MPAQSSDLKYIWKRDECTRKTTPSQKIHQITKCKKHSHSHQSRQTQKIRLNVEKDTEKFNILAERSR